MLYLLQMGTSKVLITLPLQIQNSWQLSLLELPLCCAPASNSMTSTVTPHCNCDFPFRLRPVYLHCSRLQTSYPPTAHFASSSFAPGFPSTPPAPSPPLTPSEFFNGMLVVFKSEALNYYTFFRPILLALSVLRNLISTHLPLSGSLDSLLCDLIAPTPGLAFSLVMQRTLAATSSFSSGRAYPFLNFLPPLFLHLTPTLIM